MQKLSFEEMSNVVAGEAITLTAVMAIMSIAVVAVIIYRLFMSESGSTTLPVAVLVMMLFANPFSDILKNLPTSLLLGLSSRTYTLANSILSSIPSKILESVLPTLISSRHGW